MKNSIKRIQSESLLSTLLSARILREANTLKYIALAAMAISFAACEQEDFTPAVQGDPDAVRINATIGNLQTRVAYSGENGVTSFSSGDAIKVVNSLRTSKNEATYTTADGTNWTTTDAMVWNSSSKNQFNAYYPVADYSSFESFTIPEDQSSEAKLALADWMTAKTDEIDKPESGVLNLNFEHCLAKVTVNLTFGLQYPEGSQSVSDFTFYTNDATPRAITPLENSETSYTAILRPGGYAEGTNFITLTMNDVDEHYVYGQITSPDGVSKTAINIEAGKHYTFTLKVGKDKVSLSSVNVVGWDVKEIEGGVAEEVPPTHRYDETTNTYTVYLGEYLQTAFDEAELTGTAENPATVKLMADMEVTGVPNGYQDILVDAGVIIIDLNGHTIKGTGDLALLVGNLETGNGATVTIDDSSDGKQGKIIGGLCAIEFYHSNLIINNGTFECWHNDDQIAIYDNGDGSLTINGGTFKANDQTVYVERSDMTITGGTFISDDTALTISVGVYKNDKTCIISGGSFTGETYDISPNGNSGFLSFNADTGEGATFPGGIKIQGTMYPLNSLVANDAAYYDADGNQITEGLDGTNIEGTVTVKRVTE